MVKVNLDKFYKAQSKATKELENIVAKVQPYTDIVLNGVWTLQDGVCLIFDSEELLRCTRMISVENFCKAVSIKEGKVTEIDLHQYCI